MSTNAQVNLVAGESGQPEGVSLSAFLARVKAAVQSAIPQPVWVRAEIRKLQVASSGNAFLELEERSDKGLSIAASSGRNGENLMRAEGATSTAAWQAALVEAQAVGMAPGWRVSRPGAE